MKKMSKKRPVKHIKIKKHSLVIGLAILIFIAFGYFLIVAPGKSVGQAVQYAEIDASKQGASDVYIALSPVTGETYPVAAPGDIIPITVMMNTPSMVTSLEAKLIYDSNQFTVVSDPKAISPFILKGKEKVEEWKLGKSQILFSSPDVVTENGKSVFTFNVKVNDDIKPSKPPLKFSVQVVALGGQKVVDGKKVDTAIYVVREGKNVNAPFLVDTEIEVVPSCPDKDKDGWADETANQNDMRACSGWPQGSTQKAKVEARTIRDCHGSDDDTVYPGALEICDGQDNDCDSKNKDDESDFVAKPNTVNADWMFTGVCAGYQVCVPKAGNDGTKKGKLNWETKNSYEAPAKYSTKLVTPKGSTTASEAYMSVEDVSVNEEGKFACDFLDNDCDGIVDEGADCKSVGGVSIPTGLLPPGNAFYDFKNKLQKEPQELNNLDAEMVLNTKLVIDSVGGGVGENPIWSKLKGIPIWSCDNGNYFTTTSEGKIYKYTYNTKTEGGDEFFENQKVLYSDKEFKNKVVC